MLFNSHIFILVFLPLVVFLHDLVAQHVFKRQVCLLLASLFFYGYWNPIYLPLLIFSIGINYAIGEKILQSKGKIGLKCGLIFNLGLLGLFKYTDFCITNVNTLTGQSFEALNWILPLGISFYTFQQISYLLDLKSGLIKEKDFLSYSTYVIFFPQLIAGPIVRYQDLRTQFKTTWGTKDDWHNRCKGLYIFALGCSKKCIIADSLAPYVNTWHESLVQHHQPAFLEAWLMALAYPFQIYFDFSGYSDMAIGSALMFGVTICQNFNSPFHAKNMSEYWQKWHISLSQCFQRYLFNPIAMSLRHYPYPWVRQIFPFLIVMTLIGFWHGAGWTFIIWGACHGILLAVSYTWKTSFWAKKIPLSKPQATALTFFFTVLVFVWFRAENIPAALELFKGLFGFNGIVLPHGLANAVGFIRSSFYIFPALHDYKTIEPILALVPAIIISTWCPNTIALGRSFTVSKKTLAITIVLLFFCLLRMNEVSVFLYYQF